MTLKEDNVVGGIVRKRSVLVCWIAAQVSDLWSKNNDGSARGKKYFLLLVVGYHVHFEFMRLQCFYSLKIVKQRVTIN